ncbi:MAG: alkaline phosphatase family protein [Patescibacteria group bacterium]
MINRHSLETIEGAKFSKLFIRPLYDSYCFSNIPRTIQDIFFDEKKSLLPKEVLGSLPSRYEKIVLFVIDGFGWQFFERYSEKYPFLRYIVKNGVVSQLTTQYPSTTASEMTTIHTGLPVGEGGVYEWFYYEPKVDAIIAPLLFSFAGKKERGNLQSTGIDPKDLFPQQTLYAGLREKNIDSFIFSYVEYAQSPYTKIMTRGGTNIPYATIPEALTNLSDLLITNHRKSYYVAYFDTIDKIAHQYGPDSPQFAAEVDAFFYSMERFFLNKLKGKLKNTLCMITADHGHASINPKTTIYLNQRFPQVAEWLKTNKKGELLVPAGSCRNMILHVREEYLSRAHTFLRNSLACKAEVYYVDDLIKQKFFGLGEPSKVFLDRIGNLAILPYNNESVWWYEKDKFEIKYYGHHGGMTPEEMKTILLCLSFS